MLSKKVLALALALKNYDVRGRGQWPGNVSSS